MKKKKDKTPIQPVSGTKVPRFAGASTFARLPELRDVPSCDVAIVGVPFDAGTSYRPGARFGPQSIRQASRHLRTNYHPAYDSEPFLEQQVADAGDITCNPFNINESVEQIQKTQSIESVGSVVTETTARAEKILPDATPEKQYEFAISFIKVGDYDTAMTVLKTKSGKLCQINNSRQTVYGYDQRIEILGSKGSLQVGNQLLHGLNKGTKRGFSLGNPKHFFIDRYADSYELEMRNFIDSIKGKEVSYPSVKDAFKTLEAGIAANKSLIKNKPIQL